MTTPELRQLGTLEAQDFDRHPVWIGCHTADYGKSWYGQTDEETFRPWKGELPVDPAEGMFLVRAVMQFRDGSSYPGFVTPAIEGKTARAEERAHLLGVQQPHIFVGDRTFGFWGGIIGVAREAQQALYATLGKKPEEVFPLRFSADPGLSIGVTTGSVHGFYRRTSEGIQTTIAEPRADGREVAEATGRPAIFTMSAKTWLGYPRPGSLTNPHVHKSVVYSDVCLRCGIHETQGAPFRFAKSDQKDLSGFMQFNWVADSFFVRQDISQEIVNQGITGVTFGPAVDHRTGNELTDRVQMLLLTIIPCVETSRLPTVTCRPENEEVVAFRKRFPPSQRTSILDESRISCPPGMERKLRWARTLPYCSRVKYHVPTSIALIADKLKDPPDLFQTAEWFGSGAVAFRLTIASERFVNLVRERRWKGLVFDRVNQSGWSERTI